MFQVESLFVRTSTGVVSPDQRCSARCLQRSIRPPVHIGGRITTQVRTFGWRFVQRPSDPYGGGKSSKKKKNSNFPKKITIQIVKKKKKLNEKPFFFF